MLSKYFHQLSEFYRVNLLRRLIIGSLFGGITSIFFLGLTFILELILSENAFNRTFLHDFPLIGIIIALVISFEVFGLIPHPTIVNNENKSIEIQMNGLKFEEDETISKEL